MADVLFTLPGKLGDNLARLPVAHRWALERGAKADLCLDRGSMALVELLKAQDWVDQVLLEDVFSYNWGGQPRDFGKDAWFRSHWREVWHLGFKAFVPLTQNLTHEALDQSGCPVRREGLLNEACIRLDAGPAEDLLIHLDCAKAAMREEARATLAPIYGRLGFRTIFFTGTDLVSPFYDPFRRPNTVFLDSRAGLHTLLEPLSTSKVFCADSAMRWLAGACGVERAVVRPRVSFAFHGERSSRETVLEPGDAAGLLKFLAGAEAPLLRLGHAARRVLGLPARAWAAARGSLE